MNDSNVNEPEKCPVGLQKMSKKTTHRLNLD